MNSHHHSRHKALNEGERRKWQNPEAILAEIGMRSGLTFMDIGCGEGFFAIPAARMAGKSGKIYCLDVSAETIQILEERALKEDLSNLDLRIGEAENAILCTECADVIFYGGVLHDFKDPTVVLKNARIMLKTTGILVDVDWKKEALEFGPPLSIRFDPETAARFIEAAGFTIKSIKESGLYHYIIIAQ